MRVSPELNAKTKIPFFGCWAYSPAEGPNNTVASRDPRGATMKGRNQLGNHDGSRQW